MNCDKNEIVANTEHEYIFIVVLLCSSRCAFAHLIKTLKYYKRMETVDPEGGPKQEEGRISIKRKGWQEREGAEEMGWGKGSNRKVNRTMAQEKKKET